MTKHCPLCGLDALQQVLVDETMNYAGTTLLVRDVAISRCDACGGEVVLPDQVKVNSLRFADAKRIHDDLKTSREIRAWRTRLNLTQAQASTLLGGGVNAFSKYERGEVIQSRPMDLLMRVAEQFRDARGFLFERAGLAVSSHDDDDWQLVATSPEASLRIAITRKAVAANEDLSEWHEAQTCYAN